MTYRFFRNGRVRCAALAIGAIIGAASLCSCGSAAKGREHGAPARVLLTDAERRAHVESFDIAWETIRDGHFDPNLNGVDWNAAKVELRPRVEAAETADDARGAISEMLARLKQTHFGVIPGDAYERIAPAPASSDGAPDPAPGASGASNHKNSGVAGLRVRVVQGRVLVTKVREDTPAYGAGVRPGWVVEQIAGRDVASRAESGAEPSGGSPALELAMIARAIESRLDGPVGSRVPVTFIDGADRRVELNLERVPPRGSPSRVANLPTMFVEIESRRLPENVGYIALSIFLDPAKVNPAFESALREFADADGLVLDLRGNPGGLGVMAIGLGGNFVDEKNQRLGTMKTRAGSLNFVLNPRASPFTKPLAILVDEASLSTSEILAGGLQDLKRARVFGTRTGGAALPSVIKKLPSGDALQYAMADYVSVAGRPLEGVGVTPDEPVDLDRAVLLTGTDPVLAAAVRWILMQSNR